MDDVLVEMEAIREFVVESLAEFRSELSAMNLKIQSADKKTDELDNSYKDICEKYSGLEERIENVFKSSGNSSTDSGKRKYIADDEEEEDDETYPLHFGRHQSTSEGKPQRNLQKTALHEKQRKSNESATDIYTLLAVAERFTLS